MGEDLVPRSRRLKVEPKNPRSRQHRARPCKKRKSGAPTVLMMPVRSKARATRRQLCYEGFLNSTDGVRHVCGSFSAPRL